MKARKKLKLAELKVRSFVTLDNVFFKETIKGGGINPTDNFPSEGPPSTDSANYTVSPKVCNVKL